jgi:exodeoxyribonuclease VII small subunit
MPATPKSADSQPNKAADTTNFEVAMERLEKIVAQMESAQMPLDELLERYEEGTQLIGICQEKLKAAEQRIEMVTLKASPVPSPVANTATFPKKSHPPDPDVSLF